jgi:hypothetical protein
MDDPCNQPNCALPLSDNSYLCGATTWCGCRCHSYIVTADLPEPLTCPSCGESGWTAYMTCYHTTIARLTTQALPWTCDQRTHERDGEITISCSNCNTETSNRMAANIMRRLGNPR